jgi:hypothetical protein
MYLINISKLDGPGDPLSIHGKGREREKPGIRSGIIIEHAKLMVFNSRRRACRTHLNAKSRLLFFTTFSVSHT